MIKSIYLIGAIKNKQIPLLGNALRRRGYDVFDDWYSPGEDADTNLLKYEKLRGHNYRQALQGWAARHVYEFDKKHIDRCDVGVMLAPAGRSGHLELGYMVGCGKPGIILFEKEPTRFDVMLQLATAICFSRQELFQKLESL